MSKNAVVHFEIYADDPDALQKFYTGLFDWSFEPVKGMDYRIVKTAETDAEGMPVEGGINGGMMKRPAGYAGHTINYVNVDSVDATLQQARRLGAQVMKEKSAVEGMGWFALLSDPQGNPFGVWQTDPAAK